MPGTCQSGFFQAHAGHISFGFHGAHPVCQSACCMHGCFHEALLVGPHAHIRGNLGGSAPCSSRAFLTGMGSQRGNRVASDHPFPLSSLAPRQES